MTSLRTFGNLSLCTLGLLLAAACSDDDNIADGTSGSGGGGSAGTVSSIAEAVVLWDSCLLSDDGLQGSLNNAYYERRAPTNPNFLTYELMDSFIGKPATCAMALGSVGLKLEQSTDCTPGCASNTVTGCDGELKYTLDCSVTGTTCVDGDCDFNPEGQPCDNGTYKDSCVDGKPLVCTSETTPGLDCAKYGLTCAVMTDDFGMGAACVGTGTSCTEDRGSSLEHNFLWNTIACEGNNLRMCVNGNEHAVDCGEVQAGFSCFTNGVAFCGKADECGPEYEAHCEGNGVVLCDAGKLVTVDCTALGFSTCDPTYLLCK